MIRCQDNDNISSQKYKEFTYYASNFGGIMFFRCLKLLFEETTAKTILARSYIFGSTAYYQLTSLFATIRSHVYIVVGALNNIHIVLNDD